MAARIPKLTSSVHDVGAEKPPFGSRFLTENADVWTQNAWDHVPPPDDQADNITSSLRRQRLAPVPDEDKEKYNSKPAKYWDNFYKTNADNFFRDRKWLHLEFPELLVAAEPESGETIICEIGCGEALTCVVQHVSSKQLSQGAGNAAFPLLSANKNPRLAIRAYDYSSHAVKLNNPLYNNPPIGSIQSAVWDLTSESTLPPGIEPASVDIVLCVFVLSALHPNEWGNAIANIHRMLKPGGIVLVRDYGRYDLTQLRFKSGRMLEDNFYIRGDKTRVYFFELGTCLYLQLSTAHKHLPWPLKDELALMFTGSRASSQTTVRTTEELSDSQDRENDIGNSISGPVSHTPPSRDSASPAPFSNPSTDRSTCSPEDPTPATSLATTHPNLLVPLTSCPPHPLFTIEQLGIDRRLLVNRKRQLKMYRVWMQGKFKKLSGAAHQAVDQSGTSDNYSRLC
ncbi:S-adenosyl-L-methionine-dependent methyltransferase [Lanmaoa asiatica]|nr:S-adenosyl-L-methionine-dependent methyltransferase [Lanmaoa asiatica]